MGCDVIEIYSGDSEMAASGTFELGTADTRDGTASGDIEMTTGDAGLDTGEPKAVARRKEGVGQGSKNRVLAALEAAEDAPGPVAAAAALIMAARTRQDGATSTPRASHTASGQAYRGHKA